MTPWKMFQRQIITPDKEACEGNVHSAPQSAWGGELGPASLRPCIPLLPLSLGRPESFQICHLRGLLVLPCPVDTQTPEDTVITLCPDPLGHWVSSGMVTTLNNQEEEQRNQEDQGVTGRTTLPRIHLLTHT